MLAGAKAGSVTHIFAYDQDRLARHNWIFAGLLRSADRHGFRVNTPAGDLADDERRTFAGTRGVMDGGELRKIRKRKKATSAMQDARGDHRGTRPFGYAFRTAKMHGTDRVIIEVVNPEAIAHVVETYRRDVSRDRSHPERRGLPVCSWAHVATVAGR
jgi:hypothetical protein